MGEALTQCLSSVLMAMYDRAYTAFSDASVKQRKVVVVILSASVVAYWFYKKRRKQPEPIYTSSHRELWDYSYDHDYSWDNLSYEETYERDYSTHYMHSLGAGVEKSSGAKSSKTRNKGRDAPNFFVAIPISNRTIRQEIEEIQRCIRDQNDLLKHWFVSPNTLHLTLAVFKFETDEMLETAKAALDFCFEEMSAHRIGNPILNIHGVDNFRDQVLYAAVARDSGFEFLNQIADIVTETFNSYGLPVWRGKNEDSTFNPHITIMKTTNAFWLKKKGLRRIEPFLYEDFVDNFMGSQRVDRLQLCAMHKPKNKRTGYYHVERVINLTTRSGSTKQKSVKRNEKRLRARTGRRD